MIRALTFSPTQQSRTKADQRKIGQFTVFIFASASVFTHLAVEKTISHCQCDTHNIRSIFNLIPSRFMAKHKRACVIHQEFLSLRSFAPIHWINFKSLQFRFSFNAVWEIQIIGLTPTSHNPQFETLAYAVETGAWLRPAQQNISMKISQYAENNLILHFLFLLFLHKQLFQLKVKSIIYGLL